MSAPEAAQPYAATGRAMPLLRAPAETLATLSWAFLASTLHRIRRGEGALLAVNLSLIATTGTSAARAAAQALVSTLAVVAMYAFNDLFDAPADRNNPKKDRALIATYMTHRRLALVAALVMKVGTVLVCLASLGPRAAAAVTGVMIVNVLYSAALKGVPVVDIAWVWLWGALYAAVTDAPASLLVVVGLMTAVCHLFQALGDRGPDTANGIRTTAVESSALTRYVVIVLSLLLFVSLRDAVGMGIALTAFTPLAIFFVTRTPATGWIATKVYFAFIWLYLLGNVGAAG
ncbi:MAG TPA: UbiA family prenyltransferase [Candidatus Binatia bacterium]|nr:UbiA family prenyltransferase [Candidatus Binatia bacterium]